MASLGSLAQDPIQVACIRRKQGIRPFTLITKGFVQVHHLQHQVKAALPALPQTSLIEAPTKRPNLLLQFLAWMPNFIFNNFPLLQEDPDFIFNPWAIGRNCKGQKEVTRIPKVTHQTLLMSISKGNIHEQVNSSQRLLLPIDWAKMVSFSYQVVWKTVLPALSHQLPCS